jgi:hypothetical protein
VIKKGTNMSKTIYWEFRTKQFRVVFSTAPEEFDPSDTFERQEDIDAIRESRVEWFGGNDPDAKISICPLLP